MMLAIDSAALREVEREHSEALRVLADDNSSGAEREAARGVLTVSPRRMLEIAVRCLRVR